MKGQRMPSYTHWLVTRGRLNPRTTAGKQKRVEPLVLAPIEVPLPDLTKLVRAEIETRAAIFLPASATEVDRLAALGGDYAAQTSEDLWVYEVRLSPLRPTPDLLLASETATLWTLVFSGRDLPDWQAPADGIIPAQTPVTIRSTLVEPAQLKVIDD